MKNPLMAGFLSTVWPGIGQLYNGQVLKGWLIILLQIVLFVLADAIYVGWFLPLALVLVWSIWDAHRTAVRSNATKQEIRRRKAHLL